ncbi:hypothetical protein SK128_002297, partial [Halocaridina rubra]
MGPILNASKGNPSRGADKGGGGGGGGGGRGGSWSWKAVWVLGALLLITSGPPNGEAEAAPERNLPPPCESQIYCYGDLLKTVQMAHLYNDSKYFVDMPLQRSPNETLIAFQDLLDETGGKPSKEQ